MTAAPETWRPKVLLVSHEASRTGAPRVAVDLLTAFENAGWEPVVWHRWGGPLLSELDARASKSVRQPLNVVRARLRQVGPLRTFARRLDRWGIRRTIALVDPDLVWCNTTVTAGVAVASLEAGRSTVLHVHETAEWARERIRSADPILRSATLVACSDEAALTVSDALGIGVGGVSVITSAVDTKAIRSARSSDDRSVAESIVVACGRGVASKGFDLFVDAARLAEAGGCDARWRWIGAVDPKLPTGRVEVAGESQTALREIAAAAVFVLPSRNDSFPLVVLEAMALCRPVVTSDLPGPVEQVGDAGVVVPQEDPAALAAAVMALLDDPDRAADLGRRAAERCAERWDVARFADSVHDVLDSSGTVRQQRPISVAHVVTGVAAGGGVQTVVRDLAVSASPMSLTTHVITTRPAERSGDLGALPITLHPLDYVRGGYRPIDRLRLAWGVARLVRRIRPDVVQLHSGIGWLGIVARFTAPRTPFVLEVHDAPGSGRHSHFTDMMEGWWVRRLGVTAICHSTSVRDEVRASWRPGEGKVVMFPLGVDTDLFSPIDHGERDRWRCEVGVQDSDVVVLAVGRIVESKRFGDAVEAVASADRLGTRVHLVVVGGGSETMEAELRDRAEELGVSDRVHLIGPRSRRALADAYGSADIVLSASGYEGFGLVVVEAMSAGVPVVATAVGGVTDLIDPDVTGLLVDVGDVGAMAMALQRLAEDDELRLRMGAAGRIRSLEKFSMGVATRNFVKTYRELARR